MASAGDRAFSTKRLDSPPSALPEFGGYADASMASRRTGQGVAFTGEVVAFQARSRLLASFHSRNSPFHFLCAMLPIGLACSQ